ncbi:MAG: FecR domain-containing protein [Bacteroidales bacterium]|nr:FecR domain-containing protein [Bacteroidales bacterium]
MKKEPNDIDQRLLVLYLLDEISQPGRREVEAWMASSEENRVLFEDLRKVWEETGKIDPAAVEFDAHLAWERMADRIKTDDNHGRYNLQTGRIRVFMLIAAVLVLGAVSVVFTRYLKNRQEPGSVVFESYVEVMQDTLSDGSAVVLNTETRLTVPESFAQTDRKVKLRGEAFFEVTHDAARPFIIDAGAGRIKVLGTSFQVKAYPGSDLEVYVESGRVELSAVDSSGGISSSVVLKAGERGRIRIGSQKISTPEEIGADELYWANKKLIFQETRLSVVFDLLRKHYHADIEVRDSTISNCLLSAVFTNEPIDQILEVVAASFDLKLSQADDRFILNGKGCGNE